MTLSVQFVPQTLSVAINPAAVGVGFGNPVARRAVERDPYEGDYAVDPDEDGKVLSTNGLRMTDDVTVNPVPSDYVGSAVPRINVAYPSITIKNSTGVASCTVTMGDGYTQGGTTGAALQLTTQAAATITPSNEEQTAVAAYRWTTGIVKVAPIPSNYGLITWNGSTLTVS